jgi:hypothetical protein
MTSDTLTLWMSSCKPIVAVAIAQLVERGRIDLEVPVAEYVPERAQPGKSDVRVRHVLTHTGGLRAPPFVYPDDDWETSIAKICAMRLEPGWVPEERAGYHVHSGWLVLGARIERVSGTRVREYLRRNVLEPSGMLDSWMGMPPARYAEYGERVSVMLDTSTRVAKPWAWHTEAWVTGDRPSGNAYGPARELGAFYEMLLRGGIGPDGARVLESETVERFTRRHRTGMRDRTFKAVLGLGARLHPRQQASRRGRASLRLRAACLRRDVRALGLPVVDRLRGPRPRTRRRAGLQRLPWRCGTPATRARCARGALRGARPRVPMAAVRSLLLGSTDHPRQHLAWRQPAKGREPAARDGRSQPRSCARRGSTPEGSSDVSPAQEAGTVGRGIDAPPGTGRHS